MSNYAPNPHEAPETPRCQECGEQMVEIFYRPGFTPKQEYICDEPMCPNCGRDKDYIIDTLRERVEQLERENHNLELTISEMRATK